MKNYSSVCSMLYAVMLLGVSCLFVSCSDEDRVPLDVKEITGKTISVYADHTTWNGGANTLKGRLEVTFTPIEDDDTKMEMTISNILPHGRIFTLTVDVASTDKEITFSGEDGSVNSLSDYVLGVKGCYVPTDDDPVVNIDFTYLCKTLVGFEQPYIFDFSKNVFAVESGEPGSIELDGKSYDKMEYAQKAMAQIYRRYADEIGVMKLLFHNDGTMDMSFKKNGASDYEEQITMRYWYTDYNHELTFDLDKEQAEQFYRKFFGKNVGRIFMLFGNNGVRFYFDAYVVRDRRLAFFLTYPDCRYAMVEYDESEWKETATEEEKEISHVFRNILTHTDKGYAWHLLFGSDLIVEE